MTLVKTSLLNAIAVAIRMMTLLGINKVLAIYVGPAGYAAIGNFQNAVQMITTFASGAINTGVVKYTAEYYEDEHKQHQVWQTAGSIALIGSAISAIVLIVLNRQLALWFLQDARFGGVFIWFAATLVLFVFNTLLLAILNGKKEIGRYVIANIAGSIFALVVTSLSAIQLGLYGALVGLAVYQSISVFVTLFICKRAAWFKLRYLIGGVNKPVLINLAGFAAMALTSAVCVPISQILIRNHIGRVLGWSAAGYWEAITRISTAYLMLVTTTLGIYYLPRLSELKDSESIRREVFHGYKIILPIAGASALAIFAVRDTIIDTLFTASFSAMRDLFIFELLGDVLRIGSWILAYLMLSKAMTKTYIATELAFSITYVLLVYLLVPFYHLQGVVLAYAILYFIYWVAMIILTRSVLYLKS